MPFDGSGEKPEVQILDNMRAALGSRDLWHKGWYTNNGGNAFCIIGALGVAAENDPLWGASVRRLADNSPALNVLAAIEKSLRHFADIPDFNDHRSTRLADVWELLDRAREELIECPVTP